jgi:hypothetical protein
VWSFIENGVSTRELYPFYFSIACCPKLISGHVALSDSFDEINSFLCIDPGMLMILIILSSRASCCTSVLKIQGLDEDITSMDMHEACPLDIQPIQGPITRACVRQLNI